MSHLDRVRALLKELDQALTQLEAEMPPGKARKRAPAKLHNPDALAAVRETRRRLRGVH